MTESTAVRFRRGLRLAVPVLVTGTVVAVTAAPAFAARGGHGGGGGGGGTGGSTTTGFDVSYPQCGTTLPTPTAFGIVGINDGLANNLNPCLGPSSSYPSYTQSELYWAVSDSVGGTTQPVTSLYVNTADPGNIYNDKPIADWPTSSLSTDPYGSCVTTTVTGHGHSYTVGQNSDACAWQYGYDRAVRDTSWLTSAADAIDAQSPPKLVADTPGSYSWWLDVETANSWQSDTTMNVADLQGMVAGFGASAVTTVGVYSTSSQWNSVTSGTTTAASGSLYQLPNWIPGATTESQAASNCAETSFTNGHVAVTQWTGTLDNDYPCPA